MEKHTSSITENGGGSVWQNKGGKHQERVTSWWGNAVQDVIKRKRDTFKEWQRD